MSNEIMIPNGQLPAYLAKRQDDANLPSTADMVTGTESMPKISIRGKMFRRQVPGEEDQVLPLGAKLECIILAIDPPGKAKAKKFYGDKGWDGESREAPVCSSSTGVLPDDWVEAPVARTCAECPNNAFGSARDRMTGQPKKGKACTDVKNLLVVPPVAVNGLIYKLSVPPTSFPALTEYGTKLKAAGIPTPSAVLTKIGFSQAEHPQLTFEFGGMLDEATGEEALSRAESEEVQALLHFPPEVLPSPTSAPSAPSTPVATPAPTQAPQPAPQPTQSPAPTSDWGAPAQSTPAAPAQAVAMPTPAGAWGTQPAAAPEPAQASDWGAQPVVPQPQPAAQAEAPQPAQSQPTKAPTVDSRGVAWNPEIHATSKETGGGMLKADGTWRAKRGVDKALIAQREQAQMAQAAPQQPSEQPAPAPAVSEATEGETDLGGIIDAWTSQ